MVRLGLLKIWRVVFRLVGLRRMDVASTQWDPLWHSGTFIFKIDAWVKKRKRRSPRQRPSTARPRSLGSTRASRRAAESLVRPRNGWQCTEKGPRYERLILGDLVYNDLCMLGHGLVVRAVACEARGLGFDSSSRPNGFSPRAKEVGNNWIQTW